jgi:hypothetical protein
MIVDLNFGLEKEKQYLELFQNYFSNSLKRTKQYSVFDYEGSDCLIELKSRRCHFKTYSDTMIGMNKIQKAKLSNQNIYFVFSFIDGLYYWKYDETVNLRLSRGGRKDRNKFEFKNYYFIPIEILTKIEYL